MGKFVYVMEAGKGVYKIGVSSDPQQRLKSVQTGSGDKVELVFTYFTSEPFYYEKLMHRKFTDNQVIGEWFKFKDRCFIKEIVEILIHDSIQVRVPQQKASLGFVGEYIESRYIVAARDIQRPNNESDIVIANNLRDLGCTKRRMQTGQFWVTPLGKAQSIDTKGPKEFLQIYKEQDEV